MKTYAATEKEALHFLKKCGYDSFSDEIKMYEIFKLALKEFFSGEIDEYALGRIAMDFEANPAIHNCKDNIYIYDAIELDYYLHESDQKMVTEIINRLKEYSLANSI